MAVDKTFKQINKNGILIHQLQLEDEAAALSYFSRESIENVSYCPEGLQIFFKEYDRVVKSIRRQKIEVGGLFYKIYPLVTNLSILGIGPFATNSVIERAMQSYGFIIDSYQVQEATEHEGCRTVSLTDDFRIILDIPEVLAPKLEPVRLPGMRNKTFEVLFFCRLCRSNGHMQFQCSNAIIPSLSSVFSSPQKESSFRRISYENHSLDLGINCEKMNLLQLDSLIDQRNSKTHLDFDLKNGKGQNYSADQPCYSKQINVRKNMNRSSSSIITQSHSKSISCNSEQKFAHKMDKKKSHGYDSVRITVDYKNEKFRRKSPDSKEPSTEISERRRNLKKRHRSYDYKETDERIKTSVRHEYRDRSRSAKRNKSKGEIQEQEKCHSKRPRYARNEHCTKKQDRVKDCEGPYERIKASVTHEYRDRSRSAKRSKRRGEIHEQEKCHSERPRSDRTEQHTKRQDRVNDVNSASESSTQQSPEKREVTFSLGIKEAIRMTAGALEPDEMCDFLNRVRYRKKLIEITTAFSQNISGVIAQLLEIKNNYYRNVQKRGPDEDRDISYIKKLSQRLQQQSQNATETALEKNMIGAHFKRESEMNKAFVKTESDMVKLNMKTESDVAKVHVKAESDSKSIPDSDVMGRCVKTELNTLHAPPKRNSDRMEMSMEPHMRNASVRRNSNGTEMSIKRERDMFMRQSSNDGPFLDRNVSNNVFHASYFPT